MEFIIIVGERGKVMLKGPGVRYETQIGLPTKPWRIDELMHEIRKAVEEAAYERMRVR